MARRRNLRSSRPRRRMFWARSLASVEFDPETSLKAGFPANLLQEFEDDYGADLFGFTITRIRGRVSVALDNTTVVERSIFSTGIRIADENVINSLESNNNSVLQATLPADDPHADWMWVHNREVFSTPAGDGWNQYEHEVDIKSQRRLDELGQSLYLMWGLSDATGTPTPTGLVRFFLEFNVLCKRP